MPRPCLPEERRRSMTIMNPYDVRRYKQHQHTVWSHYQTRKLSTIDNGRHFRDQGTCTPRPRQRSVVGHTLLMSRSDISMVHHRARSATLMIRDTLMRLTTGPSNTSGLLHVRFPRLHDIMSSVRVQESFLMNTWVLKAGTVK